MPEVQGKNSGSPIIGVLYDRGENRIPCAAQILCLTRTGYIRPSMQGICKGAMVFTKYCFSCVCLEELKVQKRPVPNLRRNTVSYAIPIIWDPKMVFLVRQFIMSNRWVTDFQRTRLQQNVLRLLIWVNFIFCLIEEALIFVMVKDSFAQHSISEKYHSLYLL